MRLVGPVMLVLVACSASAGVARGDFPAWLLAHQEVRVEIGVDQEILDRLKRLDREHQARADAARRAFDEGFETAKRNLFGPSGIPTTTPTEGTRPVVDVAAVGLGLAKLQAEIVRLDRAYQAGLDEIERSKAASVETTLTPAQVERVRGIERRFLGARLFEDASTIAFLRIEAGPAARIGEILRDEARKLERARTPIAKLNASAGSNAKPLSKEEFLDLYRNDPGYRDDYLKTRREIQAAEAEIRAASLQDVLSRLTPEQVRKYEEWVGRPFDVETLRRRMADPLTLELPRTFPPDTNINTGRIVPSRPRP